MKKLLSLLAVMALAITLVSCQKDTGNYLTVGLEADYLPFNWADTIKNDHNVPIHGQKRLYADGYDVTVAKHLANELGLELRVKMISWDALIPSLNAGDIDIIIAGMSPRPDRLEQINFTAPYYVSKHVAIVLKDGPLANATTLEDLDGSTGVGQLGTVYADIIDYLADNHGVKKMNPIDSVPQIAIQITKGDADFTIVEEPVALGMVANNPLFKIALDIPVEDNPYELEDHDRFVSIGLAKNRTDDLLERINEILGGISESQRNTWMNEAIERAES